MWPRINVTVQVSLFPQGLEQGKVGGQGTEPNPTPLPSASLHPIENIFGSSPSAHRLRRRRTPHSKRGSAVASFPGLEEADAGEKEAFFTFMEQLASNHLLPE